MSLCKRLIELFCKPSSRRVSTAGEGFTLCAELPATPAHDAQAVIADLTLAASDHPEAADIVLALGNLYRDQGEIEQAIRIRNNLISRPGLAGISRIRALYELGRDYRRGGFVDRARTALEQACTHLEKDSHAGAEDPELGGLIVSEMARLAAQVNDYAEAAFQHGRMGQRQAQAHYLVRQAMDSADAGREDEVAQLLRKALKAYPASPEAWLGLIRRECRTGTPMTLARRLRSALSAVEPELRFVIIEAILERTQIFGRLPRGEELAPVLNVLSDQGPPLPSAYYAAVLLAADNQLPEARIWAQRAVEQDPSFWPARLELLRLDLPSEQLSGSFREHVGFFLARAKAMNRFQCRSCGLRQDRLFFICPRCNAWHSIGLRTVL